MADPGRRRHHPEVVEGLLAPAQERVALAVSLVVALLVDLERLLVAEGVHLDRVVDDQVDVDQRVDRRRVAAEVLHRVAHRGQVDHRGDAGEVLHQHPRRLERDLDRGLGLGVPGRDRLDVVGGDRLAVLEAQRVLQQDLQRVGQAGDVELLSGAASRRWISNSRAGDLEGRACIEAVRAHKLSLGVSRARQTPPAQARPGPSCGVCERNAHLCYCPAPARTTPSPVPARGARERGNQAFGASPPTWWGRRTPLAPARQLTP